VQYVFSLLFASFGYFLITLTFFNILFVFLRATRWRSWLRHCATSRKVAGSIPDGVNGRTMALGLTQLVTEMSTRNISWGVTAAGT
jgi:hypothetical protein